MGISLLSDCREGAHFVGGELEYVVQAPESCDVA